MSDKVTTADSALRQDFKKILIIRMSSVGDVLFALPSLEALRTSYPNAHIAWVVEDRCASVLEGHPHIDELIVMPRRKWRAMREHGQGSLLDSWRFFRELGERDFDLTIDFQANLKSGMASLFSRAPVRLGFARSECREPNWLFTNRRHSLGGKVMHRIDRDLSLLSLIGIPADHKQVTLPIPTQDQQSAREFIDTLDGQGPIVILQPGTSDWGRNKRWSPESFAELGDTIHEKYDARVIINWGSEAERERAEQLVDLMAAEATIALPTANLLALGGLMQQADLVVGCDTGPTHLAELLGINVVTLFGPSDPRFYYPYGHPDRAIYAALPCSPCRYRECVGRACMAHIEVNDVFLTCDAILSGRAPVSRSIEPNKTIDL